MTPGRALVALVRTMMAQAGELRLSHTAGSLAFLSLAAIVPMFSLAFAVLAALPVFGRMRESLDRFLDGNLFPAAFSETLLSHLEQFAAKAGELSVLGAVGFFLTAFTSLRTVESTLNEIWRADRRRPLTLQFTLYWAMLTLGPLLLATGLTFNGLVARHWLRASELPLLHGLWLGLVPWLTTFVGLALLYRLMPATRVRWREALAGAFLAALLIELLRWGLGLYVARFPSYTVVYGAFAALPMFLLWLFLGWMALLAGALLAANLRWWGQVDDTQVDRTLADRFDEARAVLDAMAGELHDRTDTMLPARRLAPIFDDDPLRASETAALLVSLGYLTRFAMLADALPAEERGGPRIARLLRRFRRRAHVATREDDTADPVWSERWGWAAPPGQLSLRPLFDAIWQPAGGDSRPGFAAAFLDAPLARS